MLLWERTPITGTGERGRGDSGSEKEEAVTEKKYTFGVLFFFIKAFIYKPLPWI